MTTTVHETITTGTQQLEGSETPSYSLQESVLEAEGI